MNKSPSINTSVCSVVETSYLLILALSQLWLWGLFILASESWLAKFVKFTIPMRDRKATSITVCPWHRKDSCCLSLKNWAMWRLLFGFSHIVITLFSSKFLRKLRWNLRFSIFDQFSNRSMGSLRKRMSERCQLKLTSILALWRKASVKHTGSYTKPLAAWVAASPSALWKDQYFSWYLQCIYLSSLFYLCSLGDFLRMLLFWRCRPTIN